jgi:hypothetical protein
MAGLTGLLAVGLLSMQLGGSFGTATASTVSLGDETMVVDIEVEILASAESVVTHISVGDEAEVMPMLDRGGGVYGIRTDLPLANHVVVFEIIGPDGALSEPVTLTQLGADLTVAAEDPGSVEEDEGLEESTTRWGWLGLALGAASLSLLAVWVLGGRERARHQVGDGPEQEPAGTVSGDE